MAELRKTDVADHIDSQRARWIDAVNSGSVEGYLSVVAEDVVWFSPTGKVIRGKDELRSWLEPHLAQFDYQFEVSRTSVRVMTDWAVESATFRSALDRGGERTSHVGSYLLFWTRKTDRHWLIERYLDSRWLPDRPN